MNSTEDSLVPDKDITGIYQFHKSARLFKEIEAFAKNTQLQMDIARTTIDIHVMKFLVGKMAWLHSQYRPIQDMSKDRRITESFKKPVNLVGLEVRTREMENAVATGANLPPGKETTGAGDFAANETNALADDHALTTYDPANGIGGTASAVSEQLEITYPIPPKILLEPGDLWDDSLRLESRICATSISCWTCFL